MTTSPSALHEDIRRQHAVKGSSNRGFGIVFAVVFAVIGLLPLLGDGGVRIWSLGIAAAFLVVALVAPRVFTPANRLWTRFALLLSRVTTPVIMGMMFFTVVTPTGLMMRAFGGDPLKRRLARGSDASYWVVREVSVPAPGSMKNMF